MEFTTVRELYRNSDAYIGKEVKVGGWVRSIRDSKTFGFIVLHDGTFFETLQIVYSDKLENFAQIGKQNSGAAIIVTGTLVATPNAKQPFEIQASSVVYAGLSDAEETSFSGVSAHGSAPASENKYVSGSFPRAFSDRIRDSQVLSGERFCLCTRSADHGKRL